MSWSLFKHIQAYVVVCAIQQVPIIQSKSNSFHFHSDFNIYLFWVLEIHQIDYSVQWIQEHTISYAKSDIETLTSLFDKKSHPNFNYMEPLNNRTIQRFHSNVSYIFIVLCSAWKLISVSNRKQSSFGLSICTKSCWL